MPTIDGTWRRWHRRDLRIELINHDLETIGLLDEAYKPAFDFGCFGKGEGSLSLHLDSKFADDLVDNEDWYFRVYLGEHHLRDFMLRKDDRGYTVADIGVREYVELTLDPLDCITKWRHCLPETSAGDFETPDDELDNGFKWIVDYCMAPNAYADPVDAASRVLTGMTIQANSSDHDTSQVITQAHKQSLYEFLVKWGQNWDIDWWVELNDAGQTGNVFRFCTATPRRGEDKTTSQLYPAKRVVIDDTGLEVSEARAFREHHFSNVVLSDDLTSESTDSDSITARGRREIVSNESDSDGLDVILETRRQRDGDEVAFHETEMCQLFDDIMPGDLVTYRNGRVGIEASDETVKNIHVEFDDDGWLVATITLGDWERDLTEAIDERSGGGGGGGGSAVWSDPLLGLQVGATFVPFSDSDPSVVNLIAGAGITLTPVAGSSQITADLENTAVTPATYGDATHAGQFTVDQQGRLTQAADVAITGVTPAAHDVVGALHTITGAQWNVVGTTGVNTLGLMLASADPGAAEAILKSDASGFLEVVRLYVGSTNVMYAEDSDWAIISGSAGVSLQHNSTAVVSITTSGVVPGAGDTYPVGAADNRWSNVFSVLGNYTGDITIGTGVGVIHADSVAAGKVLLSDGTRYVPGDIKGHTDPGTCTVATANGVGPPHLHAVTSSSDPGAAAAILATDASGYLELRRLYLGSVNAYIHDTGGGSINIVGTGAAALFVVGSGSIYYNGVALQMSMAAAGADLATAARRWATVYGVAANFTGDITIGTGKGIIHVDGVTAGKVLRADGARYIPANITVADIASGVTGYTQPTLSGKTAGWATYGGIIWYNVYETASTGAAVVGYLNGYQHTHNLSGGVADAAVQSHRHAIN